MTGFATYDATMRADGSFYGECPNSGVIMAADGVAIAYEWGVEAHGEHLS